MAAGPDSIASRAWRSFRHVSNLCGTNSYPGRLTLTLCQGGSLTDKSYGAIIAKRRLVSRLAAMRKPTGLRLGEVNEKLGWERGRVDRFERNEWRKPDLSAIRDLARIYEASQDELVELME